MKETPTGTPVGVDDPYRYVDRCDHVTGDGKCRFALKNEEKHMDFVASLDGYRCPVVNLGKDKKREVDKKESGDDENDWDWSDCPNFQCREHERRCMRCGLEEKRVFDERPLLEEHHLSYPDDETGHEITVSLCRWCHAKIHNSGARIDDDAKPDEDALEEIERRKEKEEKELGFRSAAERLDDE